jgi:hypothetical protein
MEITLKAFLGLALLGMALVFISRTPPSTAFASDPTPTPINPPFIRSSPSVTRTYYFPLVFRSPGIDPCSSIPGQSYGSVQPLSASTNPPADQNPDINISLRGFNLVNEAKSFMYYDGGYDLYAPQLATLFSPQQVPSFTSTWQVGTLDETDPWITDPSVTLLGMGTTLGQVINTPSSGYSIGFRPIAGPLDGYEAMVLYATTHRITLKYTKEDNVVYGYTIHVEDICVEPNLLALYDTLNASGRTRLPALNVLQPFGRARESEIRVSIRDTGTFLDPRSHKDWWQAN